MKICNNVVMQICNVVMKIYNVVMTICNVVMNICEVVMKICNVVMKVCNVGMKICNVVMKIWIWIFSRFFVGHLVPSREENGLGKIRICIVVMVRCNAVRGVV